VEQKKAATVADVKSAPSPPPAKADQPRGFIAEWTVTIILLLFGTTTLVQAFVIPTGSMEDTLLIGDHLLVDKLAYAPRRARFQVHTALRAVKRGDIIVFRYPVDVRQTFVKRCMGVPGDRIKLVNKDVYLNGKKLVEPYVYHKTEYFDPTATISPASPADISDRGQDMLEHHVVTAKWWCRRTAILRWAITGIPRSTAGIGGSCRATTSSASR
jgi:signal peptidase I